MGEVPHYAYLVLRTFSSFPTEFAVLCHQAETNDICLLGDREGPSPLISKTSRVENVLMETLSLQIGFRLPIELFSRMYLY